MEKYTETYLKKIAADSWLVKIMSHVKSSLFALAVEWGCKASTLTFAACLFSVSGLINTANVVS